MKKIIALVLALCLVSACAFALAAGSKGAGGLTGPVPTEEGEVSALSLTPATEDMLAKFQAAGEDASPLSVFSEETQEAARALSENADAMELMELNGASVDANAYQGGALNAVLDYDEDFAQLGDALIVVSANGQELVIKPEVTETGDLKVEIPADFMQNLLADANAFIAVLAGNGDGDAILYLTETETTKALADFSEETQAAIPADAELAAIKGIAVNTDLYQGGAVDATLDFATEANNVFAVVAANGTETVAQPTVSEDGLAMNFSEELINAILADAEAIFAVFTK